MVKTQVLRAGLDFFDFLAAGRSAGDFCRRQTDTHSRGRKGLSTLKQLGTRIATRSKTSDDLQKYGC